MLDIKHEGFYASEPILSNHNPLTEIEEMEEIGKTGVNAARTVIDIRWLRRMKEGRGRKSDSDNY